MTLALKQMHCGGKSETQASYIKSEGIQISSMFVFPLSIGGVYSVVLTEEYASARNDWTPVSTAFLDDIPMNRVRYRVGVHTS
jgi:hypothetical protein